MPTTIERIILRELCRNDEFLRKIYPFLKEEYFSNAEKKLFTLISEHISKFNTLPTVEILHIAVSEQKLDQQIFDGLTEILSEIQASSTEKLPDFEWLKNTTEEFCQQRALYNAAVEAISILDGKKNSKPKTALPQVFLDALNVGFNNSIGHDYLDDATIRFDSYHSALSQIPFGDSRKNQSMYYFNKITGGGLPRKTLTVLAAASGKGKSLAMSSMAANFFLSGYNVLYVTLEMSDIKISERIDMNLFSVTIGDLRNLPKTIYDKKIEDLRGKTKAKIKVKEYPPGGASANTIRQLLDELKQKTNFIPDVIFVDYLNICSCDRFKANNQENSYTILKAVSEELRSIAVQNNLVMITGAQLNRAGMNDSEPTNASLSDSVAIVFSSDLIIAITEDETLTSMQQQAFIILKHRYGDMNSPRKWVMGVNKTKMMLYDVDIQNGINGGLHSPKNVMSSQKEEKKPAIVATLDTGEEINEWGEIIPKSSKPLDTAGFQF